MIHLVIFSDNSMSRSRELCVDSSLRHGVDRALPFNPEGLIQSCPFLSFEGRGLGYWQWKPALIWNMLGVLGDGDILIYADAGIEFIDNVNYIIDRMDQDIFLFGNQYEHAHWCKADIVREICKDRIHPAVAECPNCPWHGFGKQVQASVIFFRVNDKTRAFVKEWLDWCLFEGGRLIDDSPSRTSNHPEFQENRHDQAILTTMAYRDGIKLHAWPAVYNRFLGREFVYPRDAYPATDNYPSLFHHHRLRNDEFNAIRPNAERAVTV